MPRYSSSVFCVDIHIYNYFTAVPILSHSSASPSPEKKKQARSQSSDNARQSTQTRNNLGSENDSAMSSPRDIRIADNHDESSQGLEPTTGTSASSVLQRVSQL